MFLEVFFGVLAALFVFKNFRVIAEFGGIGIALLSMLAVIFGAVLLAIYGFGFLFSFVRDNVVYFAVPALGISLTYALATSLLYINRNRSTFRAALDGSVSSFFQPGSLPFTASIVAITCFFFWASGTSQLVQLLVWAVLGTALLLGIGARYGMLPRTEESKD